MTDSAIPSPAKPSVANTKSKSFTEGPVHLHLSRLTGFMVMGLLSVMGAALIETAYVGRLGTEALAALGFTFPLLMLFQGVSMGMGVGASSVVARAIGQGDKEQARRLTTHSFILVMTLILLLATLVYQQADNIFSLLGADDVIRPLAVSYIQIWLIGLPFYTVALVGSTLMRAHGDPLTSAILMMIGSGLHVLIAPLFMFGLWGLPELGLKGAALGFLLARIVSLLMYSYIMAIRDKLMIFSLQGFRQSAKDILHVGIPAIASNMIAPLSMTIITRLLAGYGAVVIAGFGVATRIEAVILVVVFSTAISVAPFLGQNWGAGKFDRVRRALSLANGFVVLWGVLAYTLLFFGAEWIVASIHDDAAVVQAAVDYLLIVPLSIAFLGFIAISGSSFNAMGKPLPPLIIAVTQMLVLYLPLALLGDYLWGYIGLYIATAFTITVVGIVSRVWIGRAMEAGIRQRLAVG